MKGHEIWQTILASIIGAFIGSSLGLYFFNWTGFLAGVICGGLCGAFLFEPMSVLRATGANLKSLWGVIVFCLVKVSAFFRALPGKIWQFLLGSPDLASRSYALLADKAAGLCERCRERYRQAVTRRKQRWRVYRRYWRRFGLQELYILIAERILAVFAVIVVPWLVMEAFEYCTSGMLTVTRDKVILYSLLPAVVSVFGLCFIVMSWLFPMYFTNENMHSTILDALRSGSFFYRWFVIAALCLWPLSLNLVIAIAAGLVVLVVFLGIIAVACITVIGALGMIAAAILCTVGHTLKACSNRYRFAALLGAAAGSAIGIGIQSPLIGALSGGLLGLLAAVLSCYGETLVSFGQWLGKRSKKLVSFEPKNEPQAKPAT